MAYILGASKSNNIKEGQELRRSKQELSKKSKKKQAKII